MNVQKWRGVPNSFQSVIFFIFGHSPYLTALGSFETQIRNVWYNYCILNYVFKINFKQCAAFNKIHWCYVFPIPGIPLSPFKVFWPLCKDRKKGSIKKGRCFTSFLIDIYIRVQGLFAWATWTTGNWNSFSCLQFMTILSRCSCFSCQAKTKNKKRK